MFTGKSYPVIYNVVTTIGGKYLIPKQIVTVSWYWTDDEGRIHTNNSNNVLYFPDSPLNILMATTLSESTKDNV